MEYESRRDADDAYHEMHNKRIGRDDLLKIEVPIPAGQARMHYLADLNPSGPVRHLQHPGALILVLVVTLVQVADESDLPVADVHQLLPVEAAVITLRVKTTVVSATTIDGTVTALEAPMTATGR